MITHGKGSVFHVGVGVRQYGTHCFKKMPSEAWETEHIL